MKGSCIANARLTNCRASHALKGCPPDSESRESHGKNLLRFSSIYIIRYEKWPANRLQTVRLWPQKNQPYTVFDSCPPSCSVTDTPTVAPQQKWFFAATEMGKNGHRKSIRCILSLFEPLASRISVRDREALLRRSMCTCARGAHLPTAQRDVLPTPSQHDLFRAVGSLA